MTREEQMTHRALQDLPKALRQVSSQLGAIEFMLATLVQQNRERLENAAAAEDDAGPVPEVGE